MPIPPRFYELAPPATPADLCARPFGILEELEAAPADTLPTVLLVDPATDARLRGMLGEVHALLAPQPAAARPALLALFVSSWLGGHRHGASGGDERRDAAQGEREADSIDDQEWRRRHGTNVRPLGTLRRGGQRPRALLYKLAFDEVLAPLVAGMDPRHGSGGVLADACELRRNRTGRLECRLHSAVARTSEPRTTTATTGEGGSQVELYAGDK